MGVYLNEDPDLDKSKKQEIIEKLQVIGELHYGGLISNSEIGKIFGKKEYETSEKEWNFMILNLMQIINNLGYFTTTRGRNGSIYILNPEEMPGFNENQNKLSYQNLKKRQRALNMIDPSILKDNEVRKLDFEILRNGHLQLQMSTALKERCHI